MVLDRDLIDMINRFDFGITVQLEKCIRWLALQMERAIEARIEQMWSVKPGAVPQRDTKFIWIEMFDHPAASADPAVNIRNKFNKGLNDMARSRNNHHILYTDLLNPNKHFERNGKLNYWGKMQFWREVDYYIKQFDRKKVSLNPRSFTVNHQPKVKEETHRE